ncbi:cytochrome oxidase subunit III [Neptunitalea chrysea]|uniref:Cytochrome oxidase subunit III n=1 Tax=Neptunitalea chrysea TaxID=1647581 RepID=A0A9W6B3E6_9FLAO|nr:cytochrome c oxidase subunit 3 [Neptunitalea chrysea]GLB51017.1 cytochrome oxidase subunit III [Neptunitalea chrysea]
MEATVTHADTEGTVWGGGNKPLNATYGKMMIWFFIVSDALTFSGFLVAYGFSRFKFMDTWPIADEVFTHVPFMHGNPQPMIYVAFMTFVLIISSVTMVLAVDAGHKLKQNRVAWYMFATIIGGLVFVGSQAWEWGTFIKGEYGAIETKGGSILQFVNVSEANKQVALGDFALHTETERVQDKANEGIWFESEGALPTYTVSGVVEGFKEHENLRVRTQLLDEHGHKTILSREESLKKLENATYVVEGANLHRNEYGSKLFADFFFFITGFHGFHVFSGVVLNIIIFTNVIVGTYEKRKSYEMVEKVGLYWHFVDLVWVFVFTFFYLV